MGDDSNDPVDHARTTRKHAGETMKNGMNAPGLLLLAVAIVAMVCALAAFATGAATIGMIAAPVSAVGFLAGAVVLYLAHRQVRVNEARWLAEHPHAESQPPAS